MKITVSQLRRIIKEEVSRARHSRPRARPRLHEVRKFTGGLIELYELVEDLIHDLSWARRAAETGDTTFSHDEIIKAARYVIGALVDSLNLFADDKDLTQVRNAINLIDAYVNGSQFKPRTIEYWKFDGAIRPLRRILQSISDMILDDDSYDAVDRAVVESDY